MISEKQKERIRKEIQNLQDELNLFHWRIQLAWEPYEHPDGALAETRPNTPYNDVIISIYPAFEKEIKKGREDAMIVLRHEMCHVVLAPLVHVANQRFIDKEAFMDTHETITSQLEKIISRLQKNRKTQNNVKISK